MFGTSIAWAGSATLKRLWRKLLGQIYHAVCTKTLGIRSLKDSAELDRYYILRPSLLEMGEIELMAVTMLKQYQCCDHPKRELAQSQNSCLLIGD